MSLLEGKVVLLTGASGFIGSHLARYLYGIKNIKLVFMSRKPLPQAYGNAVFIEESLELLSKKTWENSGVDKIDYIFHLAGFAPKKAGDADLAEQIYTCNLLGTRALLNSLPNMPERIVFSSTLDVYAALDGDQRISECSHLGDSNLYGISKLFCEKYIASFSQKNGIDYAILRYGHIYGPGEDEYIKLIPQTILSLLNNKMPMVYGDGSALRDFIFVQDAVIATIRAMESQTGNVGPINIVSGSSVSVRDIIKILMTIAGRSDSLCEYVEGSKQKSFIFDDSKMRTELGDWPKVSLFDGLKMEYETMKVKYG
jgi:UDP-glucose 4-epimerase